MKVFAKNQAKMGKKSLRTGAAALITLLVLFAPDFARAHDASCAPGDAQNYVDVINDYFAAHGRDALKWNDSLSHGAEKAALEAQQKGNLAKLSLKAFLLKDGYDLSRADTDVTVGGSDIQKAFHDNLSKYQKFLAYPFKEVGAACVDGAKGKGPYRALIVAVQKTDIPENERKKCAPGFARAVLTYTNDYRKLMKLRPLQWNDRLAAAAAVQAEFMSDIDNAQHEGPDGGHANDRVEAEGYEYYVLAENVASGQKTPLDVVMEWRYSPPHDKNLRNPDITEMGAACADKAHTRQQIFWVQDLGAPQ